MDDVQYIVLFGKYVNTMNETQAHLEKAQHAMEQAYTHTHAEFSKLRVGRALPSMLDSILVMHYGHATPLKQVASVGTTDASTLVIKPWEPRLIPEIEKAILHSGLGLNPQNDGQIIRVHIPPLTEERRKILVKQVRVVAENGRVAVRNVRKHVKETLKRLEKSGVAQDTIKAAEAQTQHLTNTYIHKLDTLLAHKEAEVMAV